MSSSKIERPLSGGVVVKDAYIPNYCDDVYRHQTPDAARCCRKALYDGLETLLARDMLHDLYAVIIFRELSSIRHEYFYYTIFCSGHDDYFQRMLTIRACTSSQNRGAIITREIGPVSLLEQVFSRHDSLDARDYADGSKHYDLYQCFGFSLDDYGQLGSGMDTGDEEDIVQYVIRNWKSLSEGEYDYLADVARASHPDDHVAECRDLYDAIMDDELEAARPDVQSWTSMRTEHLRKKETLYSGDEVIKAGQQFEDRTSGGAFAVVGKDYTLHDLARDADFIQYALSLAYYDEVDSGYSDSTIRHTSVSIHLDEETGTLTINFYYGGQKIGDAKCQVGTIEFGPKYESETETKLN